MSNPDLLAMKHSPSQQQHLSYLLDKHKLDEKLPIILPTIITHKNSYSSLSEQFRHAKKIDAIQKLQYVISFNPEQEFILLKEFLNKIGIFNETYHQSKYLAKLSKFIQNHTNIDPNKSLYEIILNVLKNDIDECCPANSPSSKKKSIILNASNKEMLYISPLKVLQKRKSTCVRLRESHSQKEIETHKQFLKRDMYELIDLERQARINLNNKTEKELNDREKLDESLVEINNEDFVSIEEKLQFDTENNNNNDPIKKFNVTDNTIKYNDSFCNDAKNFLYFSRKIDGNFNKGKEANKDKEKMEILEKSKKCNDALIYKSIKLNLHQNLNDYKVFPVYKDNYYTPKGINSVIERLSCNNYHYNNQNSVKKKLSAFISLENQKIRISKLPFNRIKFSGEKQYK